MKKSLNLGTIGEEKLENSLAFSRDEEEEEEEEGTCTSSKGQYDGSHPNDQTVDSPLKKKKHEKTPIVKKVSISTKQRL